MLVISVTWLVSSPLKLIETIVEPENAPTRLVLSSPTICPVVLGLTVKPSKDFKLGMTPSLIPFSFVGFPFISFGTTKFLLSPSYLTSKT